MLEFCLSHFFLWYLYIRIAAFVRILYATTSIRIVITYLPLPFIPRLVYSTKTGMLDLGCSSWPQVLDQSYLVKEVLILGHKCLAKKVLVLGHMCLYSAICARSRRYSCLAIGTHTWPQMLGQSYSAKKVLVLCHKYSVKVT